MAQESVQSPGEHAGEAQLTSAAGGAAHQEANQIVALVYHELRAVAQHRLNSERPDHTLNATALVHEAWLKLGGKDREQPWANRAHFYAAAAEAMRQILLDHARRKQAGKRGGPAARRAALNLGGLPDLRSDDESAGFLILDDALQRLERVDHCAARVVRLRYFTGLSIEQTAAAMSISEATVKRTWAFARGWLKEAIESERS